MKWIFAVMLAASAGAQALPELQKATERDLAEFAITTRAIEAQSYREKVGECSAPEWADEEFITRCLDWARDGCIWTPENPNNCRYEGSPKNPSEGSVGR